MTGDRVEIYRDESGEYRWRRKAANNETVADSGEGYVNKQDCEDQARKMFPDVPLVEAQD